MTKRQIMSALRDFLDNYSMAEFYTVACNEVRVVDEHGPLDCMVFPAVNVTPIYRQFVSAELPVRVPTWMKLAIIKEIVRYVTVRFTLQVLSDYEELLSDVGMVGVESFVEKSHVHELTQIMRG